MHHRHVHLVNGRAWGAQEYPRRLGEEICKGMSEQWKLDTSEDLHVASLQQDVFIDDQTGKELDPVKVKEARKAEIDYYKKMKVYRKVPISMAWENTGKPPIGIRWVDVLKACGTYRSRLVAKEVKKTNSPELFAATPPTESVKYLLTKPAWKHKEFIMMHVDVSRAYFYAKAKRKVYVMLPPEDQGDDEMHMCGELIHAMCGTRDAALRWQRVC